MNPDLTKVKNDINQLNIALSGLEKRLNTHRHNQYDKTQTLDSAATINSVSANTTLDSSYYTVLVDASGGARTITLPAAVNNSARIYIIKKTDSSGNSVTVDANASETIDGATTYVLTVQYESITVQCDGSNWHII